MIESACHKSLPRLVTDDSLSTSAVLMEAAQSPPLPRCPAGGESADLAFNIAELKDEGNALLRARSARSPVMPDSQQRRGLRVLPGGGRFASQPASPAVLLKGREQEQARELRDAWPLSPGIRWNPGPGMLSAAEFRPPIRHSNRALWVGFNGVRAKEMN
ncbi:hypothetical protein AAFF_G00035500 [Aldrovandia affinis]|uniref:Uncharacterized protein n=1 Tax=Aldrovandia affinis TaxID=143900 RepID=A0AAD7S335_9TELE|nr:hypothetical protein AAFF_G00035500 [Aldrovandia affinis]